MLFHFQFRSVAGWEPLGAGVGDGEDPVAEALAEVRGFAGGKLPAGSYQVIQARSSVTRWDTFEVGADGEILDPNEPEDAVTDPDIPRNVATSSAALSPSADAGATF